jgi:hypothetical protein
LHLNFPVENIDNRVRIMPVDRVDGSWGVIDSNDFNLFTRSFRKVFRKERIHLLGMRCRGKSERKDKYREDELLHVMHRFCPFGDVLRYPMERTQNQKRFLATPFQYLFLVYCSVEKLMHQRPNPIHFFFQREMISSPSTLSVR